MSFACASLRRARNRGEEEGGRGNGSETIGKGPGVRHRASRHGFERKANQVAHGLSSLDRSTRGYDSAPTSPLLALPRCFCLLNYAPLWLSNQLVGIKKRKGHSERPPAPTSEHGYFTANSEGERERGVAREITGCLLSGFIVSSLPFAVSVA